MLASMGPQLRFYFDFSCPYAYVAATRIEGLVARTGAELVPCPILLGGIFRARATPQNLAATLPPAKARHNLADMQRQAALAGVALKMPAGHPLRTVEALRALLVVGRPFMPLARALFDAYWLRGIDISTRAGLAQVLREAGHDAEAVLERASSPAIKQELRTRTDEALAAGVFGVPTFVVPGVGRDGGDELLWGVDRMWMVEQLLAGRTRLEQPQPEIGREQLRFATDLYFDYSSPFAYLGSARAEAWFGDRLRWRPMLLGAVFKQVGTAVVPMFEQSEAKRRHSARDLARQAEASATPFEFPAHFPLRSVLPLRLTLAAGAQDSPEGRKLVHRLFHAYWAEGQDISQPELLRALCAELGLDGDALLARAETPEIKAELRASTDAAVAAGVFGAPSFVVHTDDGPKLFWGCDRVELALRAAAGDTRVYPAPG